MTHIVRNLLIKNPNKTGMELEIRGGFPILWYLQFINRFKIGSY